MRDHDTISNRVERPSDERDLTNRDLVSHSHPSSSLLRTAKRDRIKKWSELISSRLDAGDASLHHVYSVCTYAFIDTRRACEDFASHTSSTHEPLRFLRPFKPFQTNTLILHIKKCPAPWLPLLPVNSPSASRSLSLVSVLSA